MSVLGLISLFVVLNRVQAAYVHDLDDQDHLSQVTATGLTLSQYNREIYMKITSNNGSTGYSWIIDHDACDDVVSVESGYVYYPASDEDSFDVGYGEEVFTITAEDYGQCVFRIAYARAWEFSGFEEYEQQNGYIITIPIRVIKETDNAGQNKQSGCDSSIEDCLALQQDWSNEKKAFKIIGVFAWLRSFAIFNLISFLPQAISFTRLERDNWEAGHRFRWITTYWVQVAGWITSIGTIAFWVWIITLSQHNYDGPLLMLENLRRRRGGKGGRRGGRWWHWNEDDDDSLFEVDPIPIVAGSIGIAFEIAAWITFYVYKNPAVDYALHLANSNLDAF